jgi:hypothetical protein
VDILLNFRTTFYLQSTGDEIFDPKLIARKYLFGNFFIDVLSCIPIDAIISTVDKSFSFSTIATLIGLVKI